jgi:tetratricopeptide (TPR) repeat protein
VAQQIVIDIVAETKKLTQGLDDTNKQLGGLDKNIKAAAKSAVALASAFVLKQGISFLKDGIEEAKDAAAAMRAANATFGEGSEALKKITADAEKFGKEISVDNDELIKLATQLGSRLPKEIQASSVELVKIFKDVEAFTGGAVAAEAAGGKLAKAFADGELSAKELQKIFPGLNASIYDQAEALSKAGKNQEAVNLLLTEGSKKYGDAAAKNVDATQKFNVALDNFKETLGTKVLPILEKGIDFLTRMLDAFDKLPEPVQNFSLGLLALVAIGGPLLSFIANIQSALVTLGLMPAATGAAATGVNLFSLALRAIPIVAIIATIALLIANWDDVSAAAKKLWEAINKWWDKIYEDIKDFAGKAIDWLKENWPKILAVLTGPFGLFALWVLDHKDDLIAKFKDLWEGVKTAVNEKVQSIIGMVVNWWNALKDWFVELFSDKAESLFGVVKTGWNNIKQFLEDIATIIFTTLTTKWLEIFLKVVYYVNAIKDGVIEKFNELKDKAVEKFNELKTAASKVWDSISGYIKGVATNIKNKLDSVYQDMVEVGKDIANGIIDGLFRISGVFRTKLAQWVKDNIPDWIKKVLQISSPSKVMVGIGTNIAQGLTQGLTGSNTVPISSRPILTPAPAASKAPVNITINAGAGTDAYALGRTVTNAVSKYSRVSSKTGRYTAL